MSGPLRIRFAAVLVLAGLATSPASSNIIDTLLNRTPEEAAPPAPAASAKDECLSRPGKPVDGQHWRYRLDGNRRCWFLGPEQAAASRQRVQHHAIKRRLATSEEDETATRPRKTVVDARAELVRPAPEETLQPRPVPAVKVVDAAPSVPATGASIPAASASVPAAAASIPAAGASSPTAGAAASVPATGAAALVPPPPVLVQPDPSPPEQSNVRRDNVEALLAASPASSEAVSASAPAATTVALAFVTGEERPWWMSRWFGPLLIALGLISLLVATRPFQWVALVTRRVQAPEVEDRLSPISDFESQAHLHHRRHAPAMRNATRQIAEHRRMSRPSGPTNPDITFQEAVRLLTDFDEASVETRRGALTSRHPDFASRSGTRRTYVSRTG
jgi:hypothetical protein